MENNLNTTIDIAVLLEDYLESATGHLDAVESALMGLEKDVSGGGNDKTLILRNTLPTRHNFCPHPSLPRWGRAMSSPPGGGGRRGVSSSQVPN